jgi:predicted PurR-regulated permease PerM
MFRPTATGERIGGAAFEPRYDQGDFTMRVERQVLFWLAAMLLAVLALLALKDVLLPFLVGIVIAYALNPLADRLSALGINRAVASALIVAALVVVIVLMLVFLVPLLANQVQQMGLSLPGEFDRLRGLVEGWARERLGDRFEDFKGALDRAVADLSSNWSGLASVVAKSVWAQGLALVNFLSLLLITPLVVFYLLVDWHPMLERIDTWLPRDHKATIRRLAGDINDAISAFIRGQGVVCLVLGMIYAVGLTWVGLRYGLLIGLATGILSFIPFVGWALGVLTAAILALLQFWPDTVPLLKVLGVFAAGQVIDGAFLSPKIVGSKIGLHPVWLIAALFVFSYLFGFAGMLVAVPVAAAIAVLVRFALEVYLGSSIYKGRGDLPPSLAP